MPMVAGGFGPRLPQLAQPPVAATRPSQRPLRLGIAAHLMSSGSSCTFFVKVIYITGCERFRRHIRVRQHVRLALFKSHDAVLHSPRRIEAIKRETKTTGSAKREG